MSSTCQVLNILFATCNWNVSPPVDGTNIIHYVAAKARIFKFPLDIQTNQEKVAPIPKQGEVALQHLKIMSPLCWFKQKELLKPLNKEKRVIHCKLAHTEG
jgi:hypothetical protein